MKLGDEIIKKIGKQFEPSTTISMRFRSNDMVLRTDSEGNAVQLFIGKLNEKGMIRGDRYARSIIRDREGKVIKDYWERKGRAS